MNSLLKVLLATRGITLFGKKARIGEVAKNTGLSRMTVYRALENLYENGFVQADIVKDGRGIMGFTREFSVTEKGIALADSQKVMF